jgi:hypothetical protein
MRVPTLNFKAIHERTLGSKEQKHEFSSRRPNRDATFLLGRYKLQPLSRSRNMPLTG